MSGRKTWTRDEDEFISKNSIAMSDRSISEKLNRSVKSIRHRRSRLSLTKYNIRRWSTDEDEIIRSYRDRLPEYEYHEPILREISERLGRNYSETCSRVRKLGINLRGAKRRRRVNRGREIVGTRNGLPLFRHIEVMERVIGRSIIRGEVTHHINGDKSDDSPENLLLCKNSSEHIKIHAQFFQLAKSLIDLGLVRFNKDRKEYELCIAIHP